MQKSYRTIFRVLLLLVFFATPVLADETPPLAENTKPTITIEDCAIATAIENRLPQGKAQSFPATVGELYCFTKVVGARTETSITHTWYYQDKKMAEVTLPVRAPYWRTWSTKKIMPEWKGPWRVEVLSEGDTLLKTTTFTIE